MNAPRWEIRIINPADGKPKRWDTYDNGERAESVAATLRKHGFYAVIRVAESAETPEHNGDRRAFLIWACMIGAVPPQRVVERVLEDVESGSK